MTSLSPTLTASSSTTAANSDQYPTLPKDIEDFSELFNFDDFESTATSVSCLSATPQSDLQWLIDFLNQSHSHSPKTISPNHTPSPLPSSQDFTADVFEGFDFLNQPQVEYSFELPVEKEQPDMQVKQELFDFFNIQPAQPIPEEVQSAPQPIEPQFPPLPVDQQFALQQLMANIFNYQSQFGLDVAGPSNVPAQPPQQPQQLKSTIEPSMVFSTSPMPASSASTSSYVSPAVSAPTDSIPSNKRRLSALSEGSDDHLMSIESYEAGDVDDLGGAIDRLMPLNAIFSAGRGKGGKKGGGMSSVVRAEDEDLDDDDSWRPSAEEYKKLSSKEKRQLRNKLSARAFRNRRKDYIGLLEGHIKDRDTVIDAIQTELVTSRTENQDLRRELEALKVNTMSILHPESANTLSYSPAMMSALAMSPSLPPLLPVAGSSRLNNANNPTLAPSPTFKRSLTPVQINTRKDLSSSSAMFDSSRGFWGGSDNLFGGGSTICHTMFTPDLVVPPATLKTIQELPRQNLNPRLNEPAVERVPGLGAPVNGRDQSHTFSEWSEASAFSLRNMDSYRMQIWSRLAREAQAEKSNMPADLRPKFLVEPKASSSTSTSASNADAAHIASAAQIATIATSHITSRLASSFWSAFQGPSSRLDGDKLAAVVNGTAKLKVVANEPRRSRVVNEKASSTHAQEEDNLSALLGGLKLQAGLGRDASTKRMGMGVRENPLGALGNLLKHAAGVQTRV